MRLPRRYAPRDDGFGLGMINQAPTKELKKNVGVTIKNLLLERQLETGFFVGKFITTNDFYVIVSWFKVEVKRGN